MRLQSLVHLCSQKLQPPISFFRATFNWWLFLTHCHFSTSCFILILEHPKLWFKYIMSWSLITEYYQQVSDEEPHGFHGFNLLTMRACWRNKNYSISVKGLCCLEIFDFQPKSQSTWKVLRLIFYFHASHCSFITWQTIKNMFSEIWANFITTEKWHLNSYQSCCMSIYEKKKVTSRCWWTTIIYCLALLLLTCFHWYILDFLILLIPKNCTRTTAGMRNKQTCTKRENQWWTPQKKCKWQGFFFVCVWLC